ncbi:MAG: hypothetical protein RBT68_01565 [Spirochaetia bacterium]|nr:hypothetical protein [Spirochaetia bacterium]
MSIVNPPSGAGMPPSPVMTEHSIFAREPGRLGIRIPRSAWKAAGHSASAAMRQKGILSSQAQLADWIAEDISQVGDQVICYGPGFDGPSLEELLESDFDESARLQRLAAAVKALNRLDHENSLPAGMQSAGILVSTNGDVLILPPALVSRAAARAQSGEGPSPEGNPAIAASVMLAGTLRRMYLPEVSATPGTTGATADKKNDTGVINGERRKGDPFVPLGLIAPHLDPRLAALADSAMDQNTGSPSLDDWARGFEQAGRNNYRRELSEGELSGLELQRKATGIKVARKLARRRFIARRGSLLAGLAITAVVIVAIAIFDRPPPGPDLSELGPEAVVQAYYEAIDNLDLPLLEASVQGKAGKDDKSLLTNLTVVMKMRQAYSPDELFISARDWVASGSPALAEGSLMFGITEIEIRSLDVPPTGRPIDNQEPDSQSADSRFQLEAGSCFEARYTLWTTESSEESIRGVHMSRIDRLLLEKGKKGWKIVSIEREVL